MVLLFKNLLFTLVVPATVGVYVPLLIARDRTPASGAAFAVGVAVVALGLTTYAWCVWDFATFGRGTPLPIDAPKKLVVRGLYRYTRNPMYVGVLMVVLGWAAMFRAWALVVYAVCVGACFHLFIVLYEERHLRREFGEQYEDYRAQVGRWLPRLGRRSGWSHHLRGHFLLFDKRPTAKHEASAGVRLLLTAAALEVVRLAAVTWLRPAVPLWLLLPFLLGLALLAVPALAGLSLSQIGFRRWREWTPTEKSYFLQVVLIANIVFPLVFAAPLQNRIVESGVASTLSGVFVPYLFFGFYQEVVYRGMVQLELDRRWGAPVGILVANVLYTFGPLHWNYFSSPLALAGPMFGAVFGIGLFFGLLFARSGNLWIVAVFHAIGNAYILASLAPVRSVAG